MEQWLIERLPQLAALITGITGLLAAAWKFKIGARLDRFGRWFWGEVRTTVNAKKELIECRRQSAIRERTFATAEAANEELLRRVHMLIELCGGSDSDRRNHEPTPTSPQLTTSHDESRD